MKIRHNIIIVPGAFLLLLFAGMDAFSRDNGWDWAKTMYSKATNAGYSIVADENGNSFVAGSFSDTLNIGNRKLTGRGHQDIFIAAFDPEGRIRWLKQAGGQEADEAYGISVDKNGNIYVTGYISGRADFSGTVIENRGDRNYFIAKYNQDGNLIWVRNGASEGEDYASMICTDDNGNAFITGFFHGILWAGNDAYYSKRNQDLFLMKYDTNGKLLWVKTGGGDIKDEITAIHADSKGNLYLTGTFEKELRLDQMLVESSGRKDFFLAKYDPDGLIQWLNKGGSVTGDDYSTGIEIDQADNIYICGYFSGVAFFTNAKLKSAGLDDIFLAKYNDRGGLIWAKAMGGLGNEHARDLVADASGNIYMAGEFDYSFSFADKKIEKGGDWDVFLLRFDDKGDMIEGTQISGEGFKKASGLAIDGDGNVYLLGYFIRQADLGNMVMNTVNPEGSGFIAKKNGFSQKLTGK